MYSFGVNDTLQSIENLWLCYLSFHENIHYYAYKMLHTLAVTTLIISRLHWWFVMESLLFQNERI